ncbi:hypothetical protein HDV00_005234 [Rhizophlyctis rosea]|nr:hypothetical protein HDV00_005234 [Rhizophlyctis rosea]
MRAYRPVSNMQASAAANGDGVEFHLIIVAAGVNQRSEIVPAVAARARELAQLPVQTPLAPAKETGIFVPAIRNVVTAVAQTFTATTEATTSTTISRTSTTISPTSTPTGTKKGDWDFCSTNAECANGCCANIYSTSDGRFKCTPGGFQSYCTGTTGTPGNPGTTTTRTSTTTGPSPTSVPATARVYEQCNNPNQVAVTFDDGPYQYTQELLNLFNSRNAKLTLFVNGLNWDCIYNHADVLRQAYNGGHQVGSHTWSHSDLTTLSQSSLESELTRVDTALAKILGAKPTFVRPPYGAYNQNIVNTVGRFGYTSVIMWTMDSGDTAGISVDEQFERYQDARRDVGLITLNHDVHQTTVQQLAPRILDWAASRGLQVVTVGTCLGQSQSQWYREVTGVQGPRDSSWVC